MGSRTTLSSLSFLPRPSQDVFKSVERLCEAEGIDCAKFMYRDNTTILDTLEGSRCDVVSAEAINFTLTPPSKG